MGSAASRFLAAVTLLAIGCASQPTRFSVLPPQEKHRFGRCMGVVKPCGTGTGYSSLTCIDRVQDRYAAIPSIHDRKVWLLEQGCPPSMVEPERYVSDSAE